MKEPNTQRLGRKSIPGGGDSLAKGGEGRCTLCVGKGTDQQKGSKMDGGLDRQVGPGDPETCFREGNVPNGAILALWPPRGQHSRRSGLS